MRWLESLRAYPDDWLIVAGDVGETSEQLDHVLDVVVQRFARVLWVPGNHELWTMTDDEAELRGVAKYEALVELCRTRGVTTPEDPWLTFPGDGPPTVIALMFLLYDYTFRPADVARGNVIAWAAEQGAVCADEDLLHPDPYSTREAWCAARVASTLGRLESLPPNVGTILVNHFPLRRNHAVLPRIPRFSPWCGPTATDDWHRRFRARAVVYGHLHISRTHVDDGVRFEEVSLGYPSQRRGAPSVPRQIWPPRSMELA
jgi:3',5'-cyclic AMP phosphodiesterase CpdA